ncbi:hypothetical protein ACFE04_014051 [Oxalis oulophora]
MLDLLLFENQLPYPLLSELYRLGFEDRFMGDNNTVDYRWSPKYDSFSNLCLWYFRIPDERHHAIKRSEDRLHFTDTVRCFRDRGTACGKHKVTTSPSLKYSAKEVSESKVEFLGIEDESDGKIRFHDGVLELPIVKVNDMTEKMYHNLMGFEQSDRKNKDYICSYIFLFHLLIKTSDDVAVLVEEGVIINELHSNEAAVEMFNKLCKNITFNPFLLSDICRELDDYCYSWKGRWNYRKRILKDVYFTDIWTGTGTLAAVFLLLFTLGQTITSILQVTM